ncbi:MAG: hypothetical protein ACYC8T_19890 [Myxococcaceae bacterium]
MVTSAAAFIAFAWFTVAATAAPGTELLERKPSFWKSQSLPAFEALFS